MPKTTTTAGNYSWTLPATRVSNLAKIKVVDGADANVLGGATFAMVASVSLTNPATTTILRVAQDTGVTWSHRGRRATLGNVGIKIHPDVVHLPKRGMD